VRGAAVTGLARWWFDAAPPQRLAAFRILLGGYVVWDLLARMPMLMAYNTRPDWRWSPVGVCTILDRPLAPGVADALLWVALAASVLFLLGVGYRVVAPAFAALLLWVLSYRNSWGMTFHTENLEVLHVAIVALAPAADAWSIDAWRRRRRGAAPPPADGRYGWALRAACAVTVITYVLAGIAKLRMAGWDWVAGDQLRNQIAYDNLRRAVLGADPSPVATPLLAHPALFAALAGLTMAVELGAPLALVHRRVAAVWAAMAWGFHVGVLVLMHILFPYPLAGLAYAPLFRLERPVGWIGRTAARLARRVIARR
jgi:hypothetical protein